jgi:hypothetical protein
MPQLDEIASWAEAKETTDRLFRLVRDNTIAECGELL